jgi:transposase
MTTLAGRPAEAEGWTRATRGDRLFIEAVLFRAKTGMPWRDLPERFGPWKSVYNRFANWAKKGRWELIFKALPLEVDEVGSIVDGSVVRAHQDASGGKASVPSPRASRRPRGTSWHSPRLYAPGCGSRRNRDFERDHR